MKKILTSFLLISAFFSIQTALAAFDTKTVNTTSELFDIIDIKQGNSLKMRTWPSLTSAVVVAIPHNAHSIAYKGSKVKQGEKTWKKVYWNNNEGWVNAKHLQHHQDKATKVVVVEQKSVSPTTTTSSQTTTQAATKKPSETKNTPINKKHTILACGGSTPFWNIHMDLTDKKILVNLQDGKSFTTSLNSRKWDVNEKEMRITGGKNQQAIYALLNKTNTCTDRLTTRKYPFIINLTIGESKKMSGCCRTIQK